MALNSKREGERLSCVGASLTPEAKVIANKRQKILGKYLTMEKTSLVYPVKCVDFLLELDFVVDFDRLKFLLVITHLESLIYIPS